MRSISIFTFSALVLSLAACSQPAPLRGEIFMCQGRNDQSALIAPQPVYNETGFYDEANIGPEEAYLRNLPPPRGGFYP